MTTLAPSRHAPRPATPAVMLAAIGRSTRIIFRSPALLVAPVAQSLFFLLVYAGQLSTVGSTYLAGTSFIAFLLPLILLTGVATGAGSAGTLMLGDIKSGYLDRLRLAHGTTTPFLVGPVVAALITVCAQMALTILGATLLGYRPHSWGGMIAMVLLLLILGLGVSLLSIAVAIRTPTASATNLVPLAVFGLSFFTGVFAPVDQLAGWMQTIATFNPLTYVINAARQLGNDITFPALPLGLTVLSVLVLAGILACTLALTHTQRNR